jgi:hypothetical protein
MARGGRYNVPQFVQREPINFFSLKNRLKLAGVNGGIFVIVASLLRNPGRKTGGQDFL